MKLKFLIGVAIAAAVASGVVASGLLDRLVPVGSLPGAAQAAEPRQVAASHPQPTVPHASWKQVFDFARARR